MKKGQKNTLQYEFPTQFQAMPVVREVDFENGDVWYFLHFFKAFILQ